MNIKTEGSFKITKKLDRILGQDLKYFHVKNAILSTLRNI